MTTINCNKYRIPAALPGPENPLPIFRDRKRNRDFSSDGNLSEEEKKYLGWETGFRVLPYKMQDSYSRDLHDHDFFSIEMESSSYKVIILPELGGRVVSLFDKDNNKELLFKNNIFQPANLAIRNAWFAGGIEWNIGQLGHTFSTCSPVFAAMIKDDEGNSGIRLYDYERCKNLFWQVDLFLNDNMGGLIAHVKIVNNENKEIPMYWWTNIALTEEEGARVIAPAERGLYKQSGIEGFGVAKMPYLPSINNKDGSYSLNHTKANEVFFQCGAEENPWQAVAYKSGDLFLECSTSPLKTRKLFCWGTHEGGKHWQEYLCGKNNVYLEIQAGLSPVQQCSIPMPPDTVWQWTQFFGNAKEKSHDLHSNDWKRAVGKVHDKLTSMDIFNKINIIDRNLTKSADTASEEVLYSGLGWGRLEIERLLSAGELPENMKSLHFPSKSLGKSQKYWMDLLKKGSCIVSELNTDWMVHSHWKDIMEHIPYEQMNWLALLHLGNMHMENFDHEKAEKVWLDSLKLESERIGKLIGRAILNGPVKKHPLRPIIQLMITIWRLHWQSSIF